MSTEQESTINQNPDQSVASNNLSDPSIFLTFIANKFADLRLFSVADFYNEWGKENTDKFPLIIIEKNLDNLVSMQKIEKVMCFDIKYADDANNMEEDDNDNENSQDRNFLELYKYEYTYKYKYILPKTMPSNTMSDAFLKIRNELLKGPVSILTLSRKLEIHHQKIRAIIDVLSCLDIVKVSSKGSICVWDQTQENRIRQLRNIYPQLIELRQKNENE